MKKHIESVLYTEKYRPPTLDEMILPDRIRKKFKGGFEKLPRILLYGTAGLGKTTMAMAMVNDGQHPYLYINASRESSVDVIREQITNFCAMQSMHTINNKKAKVVVLDEIDGASDQFHKALRATMDEFKHVVFVATCNFFNKIPEAIKSRFECIDFTFTDKDQEALKYKYAERLLEICEKEGLSIASDGLESLIIKYYPDMRSMLNLLQGFKAEGIKEINSNSIKNSYSSFDNLFRMVFDSKPEEIYKLLMEQYSSKVESLMSIFANEFPNYVQKSRHEYMKFYGSFVIKIGEWQSRKPAMIDPILALIAMISDLQEIVKAKQIPQILLNFDSVESIDLLITALNNIKSTLK